MQVTKQGAENSVGTRQTCDFFKKSCGKDEEQRVNC